MFEAYKLSTKMVVILVSLVVLVVSLALIKHFYDKNKRTQILTTVKIDTNTQEVKASEQANQIKQADRKLNPSTVREQLHQRDEFRQPASSHEPASSTRGESSKRVPITQQDLSFAKRYQYHSGADQHTEQDSQSAVFRHYHHHEIIEIENGINPCIDCVVPKFEDID